MLTREELELVLSPEEIDRLHEGSKAYSRMRNNGRRIEQGGDPLTPEQEEFEAVKKMDNEYQRRRRAVVNKLIELGFARRSTMERKSKALSQIRERSLVHSS